MVQQQTYGRLSALDFVRVAALLGVVIYHSAAAYSTNTPYWSVHDGSSIFATGIRELVDVFIMPIFFFLAGYFALGSLHKRGYWSFFKSKFWELEYIWLLAVIIILPFAWWGINIKSSGSSESFLHYWLIWLGNVGETRLGVATDPGQMVHMHFWFVSLLFYFFIVFILVYQAKSKLFRGSSGTTKPASPSNKSALLILVTFGLVTSVVYFISLLLVPDMSWLTVKLLVQIQPSKLFLYIAYFGLGVYGYSRNWFVNDNPLGRLSIWAPATVLLAAAFLVLGKDVFLNPATTMSLSPVYLFLFSVIRSSLLLSALMVFCSIGMRYFNRPSQLIHTLADNSYYIYLIHIFLVSILQDILMIWPEGPIVVKILAVFFISLSMSYALSRWVFKKLTIREWIGRKLFRLPGNQPVLPL